MATDCKGTPDCGPGSAAYLGATPNVAQEISFGEWCNNSFNYPIGSATWAADVSMPYNGALCPGALVGAGVGVRYFGSGDSIRVNNIRIQIDWTDTDCVEHNSTVVASWSGNFGSPNSFPAADILTTIGALPANCMFVRTTWMHIDGWFYGGATGAIGPTFAESCLHPIIQLQASHCGPNAGVDKPCVVANPPDLSTSTKTAPANAVSGSAISFTVDVHNTGTGPATNVSVIDASSPLTGITVSPASVASIAAGASATFTVNATIPSAFSGTLTNTATIRCAEVADRTVSSTTTVTAVAGTVNFSTSTKTCSSTSIRTGQQVTWTITAKNTGTAAGTNVAIADIVPSGFTAVSWSAPGCTPASGTGVIATTIPTLAAGASQVVTVTATARDIGSYVNTAAIGATSVSSPAITVTAAPPVVPLTVTKRVVSPTTALYVGDAVNFEIVATNPSTTLTASSVTITDVASAALSFNSWSVSTAGGAANPSPASGTGTVSTQITSIPPGGSVTINLQAQVIAAGAQTNSAAAVQGDGTTNAGSVSFTVNPAPTVSGNTDGSIGGAALPPAPQETVIGTNGGSGCGCGCGQISCMRFTPPLRGTRQADGCVKIELVEAGSCGPWKTTWRADLLHPNPPIVTNDCPKPIGVWIRSSASATLPLPVVVTPYATGTPNVSNVVEGLEYFVLWPGDKLTFTKTPGISVVDVWH